MANPLFYTKEAVDRLIRQISLTWSNITGKPSTFPPSPHNHTKSQITDFPTSMTPTAHTHTQSEVTGLATALSGKVNAVSSGVMVCELNGYRLSGTKAYFANVSKCECDVKIDSFRAEWVFDSRQFKFRASYVGNEYYISASSDINGKPTTAESGGNSATFVDEIYTDTAPKAASLTPSAITSLFSSDGFKSAVDARIEAKGSGIKMDDGGPYVEI